MQVRVVSIDIANKQRAVQTIQATFPDALLGSDGTFVFARTTHDEGCYVNHMRYWRELLATDEPGFWVFEDDVTFVRDPLPTLNAYVVHYALSERSVFYLGHRLAFMQDVLFERLAHDTLCVKTNDLHGYYIGREAAAKMLAPYRGVPVDVHVRNHHHSLDMRAVYPMVAIQRGLNGFAELCTETIVEFGPVLAKRWQRLLATAMVVCGIMMVIAHFIYPSPHSSARLYLSTIVRPSTSMRSMPDARISASSAVSTRFRRLRSRV